ncbi:hypothetical protein TSUD_144700 [Trifolium subterraneum]|uniref:Uncharacterized protein n=1 Tax=Trifolium subterraneum TaxID=3900 RepID=A0A2Z6NNH3_TRISU|nr:hypothetical protein TSUD_144700 [Trifolium subterraneum]
MATNSKRFVTLKNSNWKIELFELDNLFKLELDLHRVRRSHKYAHLDVDDGDDWGTDLDEFDDDDDDECRKPIVVADTNLEPPSLTPPKEMSLEERLFSEMMLLRKQRRANAANAAKKKTRDTLFLCDGRKTAEKRSERSAQITLQKKDRLSGESENMSSKSGCSH